MGAVLIADYRVAQLHLWTTIYAVQICSTNLHGLPNKAFARFTCIGTVILHIVLVRLAVILAFDKSKWTTLSISGLTDDQLSIAL